MSRGIEVALLGAGGVALFSLCFLGFAALSGVPLSEVPLVKEVVPVPPGLPAEVGEAEAPVEVGGPVERAPRTPDQVVQANLGVLGAFAVAAPFDRTELERLADELETRDADLERREHELDLRERAVEDQLALLAERFDSLASLRGQLDAQAAELELRADEVRRDERVAEASGELRYANLARLFAEGTDVEADAARLARFGPEEAARILRKLPDAARVDALLKAMPDESFLEFAEAFAALGGTR